MISVPSILSRFVRRWDERVRQIFSFRVWGRIILALAVALPWEAVLLPKLAPTAFATTYPPPPGNDGTFCEDCPAECIAPGSGVGGPGGPQFGTPFIADTRDPVVLQRGSVTESATDLRLGGPLFGWSHTRSYDSQIAAGESEPTSYSSGERWHSGATGPYLVQVTGGDIVLKPNASSIRRFKKGVGDTWTAPKDFNATLVKGNYPGSGVRTYGGMNGATIFTLTNVDSGDIYIFKDFSGSRARLFERRTRNWPESQFGVIYASYSGDNVTQITTADPQAWDIFYSYSGDRLSSISVEDGSSTEIMRADYTYFDSGTHDDDVGSLGDLVSVKVSIEEADGPLTRYTHYRYYRDTDSDGKAHQIKAVYESDAIQRAIDGEGAVTSADDMLTEADSVVDDYATRSFTYYVDNSTLTSAAPTPWNSGASENLHTAYGGAEMNEYNSTAGSGMVKTETISGACATCGGSGATGAKRYYFYMALNGGTSTDPTKVTRIVVEDTEDASGAEAYRRIWGLNTSGAALREITIENPLRGTVVAWCNSKVIGSDLLITEERRPSAHAAVDTNAEITMFLNPTGNNGDNDTDTVSDDSGVVYYYEYDTAFGDGKHRTGTRVGKGTVGVSNADYIAATDWGDATTNIDDEQPYLPVAQYVYPEQKDDRSDTSRIKIAEFTYDFHDSADLQLQKITTTLPAVSSTTQNGSGVATTTEQYFDIEGRLRWTKDGEGYVNYYSYHPYTGGLALMITDVETSGTLDADITGDGSGKWVAWSGSAGLSRGGSLPTALNLKSKNEYDDLGRVSKSIGPDEDEHITKYFSNGTARFPYVSGTAALLPVEVSKTDAGGQMVESLSINPSAFATTATSIPTTASNYTSYTKYTYNSVTGQLEHVDRYHDADGSTQYDDFYRTTFLYDDLGRQGATIQDVESGRWQVSAQLYDALDRVTETRRGVATTKPTDYDDLDNVISGPTSGFAGWATVSETTYDLGGVGDGHVTNVKSYYSTADFVETIVHRTFRGFVRATERKNNTTVVLPHRIQDVDWQGRTIDAALFTSTIADFTTTVVGDDDYVASTSSGRNEWTKTHYDVLSRVYRTDRYPGTQITNHFEFNNYYDRNGRLVCTGDKFAAHQELAYDGAGRQYQTRTVHEPNNTKYTSGAFNYRAPAPRPAIADMPTTGNGNLIEFVHTDFDDASNQIGRHTYEMNHDESNGIDIDSATYVRRSEFTWFDQADRPIAMADFGSGDATAGEGEWKYVAAIPSYDPDDPLEWGDSTVSDGLALLTVYDFDTAGRQNSVTTGVRKNGMSTDTMTTKSFYDDLGRRISVLENPSESSPSPFDENRLTEWKYNGLGQLKEIIAYSVPHAPATAQSTLYFYEDPYNTSLVTHTIYPDAIARTAETDWGDPADQVRVEYNLDGSIKKRKDQRDVEMTYAYDNGRRQKAQGVTSFGSSGIVDETIKSITRKYDSLGRLEKVTSHGNLTDIPDDTTSVQNQVKYDYNTMGKLSSIDQDHADAVGTGTAHQTVAFSYHANTTSNVYNRGLLFDEMAYPLVSGAKLSATYANETPTGYRLRRPSSLILWDGDLMAGDVTQKSSYLYNGVRRVIGMKSGITTDIEWTANTASGVYGNWDRFGRTINLQWFRSSTTHAQVKHGYDYAGNRLWREDVKAAAHSEDYDEFYTYDGLQRLKNFDRGDLTGTPPTGISGTPDREQDYALDQLGNWENLIDKTGGSTVLDQDREHNEVNEIDDLTTNNMGGTAWVDPAHDSAGNMTTMPQPLALGSSYTAIYDAWNRLVEIEDVLTNEYDGNHHRIRKVVNGGDTFDYYFNADWQMIVEAKNGSADSIYAWHLYYIDALATRMRASDKHVFTHDANFNVTAAYDVTDGSGTYRQVVERYAYTPYGEVKFLDGSFGSIGSSAIDNYHLYTGRERDVETGLQLNRMRWNHSDLGHWPIRDETRIGGMQWVISDNKSLINVRTMVPIVVLLLFAALILIAWRNCGKAIRGSAMVVSYSVNLMPNDSNTSER